MMMQRRLVAAIAARHSICSSSSLTKVSFSISSNLCTSCDSSFSFRHEASKDFQNVMNFLSNAPPHGHGYQINSLLNALDFPTLQLHHQQQFVLKVMQTSCQTKLVETPNVSPHDLIRFVKWIWKNNKYLITIPVLESLVSAICSTQSHLKSRKNDLLFLWDLLKHIGHYHTGLLNTWILNQLLNCFSIMMDEGKTAVEVFHKFEVFQCVPNQDTYYFTLNALIACSTDMLQQAASICQKMALHPETLLPDDGDMLDYMLSWFSGNNMIKEAYALYLAANEKRKRNPKWSIQVDMLLPTTMIRVLCSEKETVHLALEMLTDINIPEEVEQWEKGSKLSLCLLVVEALCWFKDFDAAKQLIFKMIADGPLPPPIEAVFNVIITAYVKAGEIGQALEMLMLSESIGLSTSHVLTCGFSRSDGMKETRKILEEAKNKDSKLFIALLYHTLIVGYFKQLKYEKALKLLTQMKDFSVFCTNLDEYHKLIHSLRLKAMDRKIEREQLEELEPIDREMAEEQLYEMGYVDSSMAEEQLEEMNLNIRASVS